MDLNLFGSRILDLMDETVGTVGLPVTAFLVAFIFRWFFDNDVLGRQMDLSKNWLRPLPYLTKYAIPVVLLIITIARLIGR